MEMLLDPKPHEKSRQPVVEQAVKETSYFTDHSNVMDI